MTVNYNLWAKTGSISLPGAGPVPFWGFAPATEGPARLPGPLLEVPQGENVEISLTNDLASGISLVFPGQDFVPQPVKNPAGTFVSYNPETASGGTLTYSLTVSRPGIFLYESGTAPEKQIQMGLYGAMVVRPPGFDPGNPATWTAYGSGSGTDFDIEKIMVLSEVDTAMHQALASGDEPAGYKPDYFLINGRSFPDTLNPDDSGPQPYGAKVTAAPGQRVLLRIINAGFMNHNIRLQDIDARVVAGDSRPLITPVLDKSYLKHTLTIGSGQSYDILFTAPTPGKYVLYDRNLNCCVNGNNFPGGIMTLVEVP